RKFLIIRVVEGYLCSFRAFILTVRSLKLEYEHVAMNMTELECGSYANSNMAEDCLKHANDLGGFLLLYSSLGDAEEIAKLASLAKEKGKNNVAFACLFMLGKLEDCLQLLVDSNRIPEAALMARSYLPSKDSRIVALWRKDLNKACAPAVLDDLMLKVVSKELNPEVNFFRSRAIRNPDAPFVTSALSQGSSMFFPHLIKTLLQAAVEWFNDEDINGNHGRFQEMLLAAMQQPMPITALDYALANAPPKQQRTPPPPSFESDRSDTNVLGSLLAWVET
ncbi:coatomer subunit beta'-2-like protein, partial [Tanacetum coccineum]